MRNQTPFVSYLRLGDAPMLVANECSACGARFFDRRNACASCSGRKFREVEVAREGEVASFSIVAVAAPGVDVPFVPAVVDCDGTSVRGNIINCPPDPQHVELGMKVRLATYVIGTDAEGVEAVNYGFEPLQAQETAA